MTNKGLSLFESNKLLFPITTIVRNQIIKYLHLKYYYQRPMSPTPPEVKRWWIKKLQKDYNCEQFIETGTYYGDTTLSVLLDFKKLHTIELSKELYKKAVRRFSEHSKVSLYKGDSGKILPLILKKQKTKTMFWLDGHYSEGVTAKGNLNTPIEKELSAIHKYYVPGSVLLIDDAIDFIGEGDYPTISKVKSMLNSIDSNLQVYIEDDIIIAVPKIQ